MDPEEINEPNHQLELFQERFTSGFNDVIEFFEPIEKIEYQYIK